jgi:uncharacterized membrane protein YtjA (UPF0391 family)
VASGVAAQTRSSRTPLQRSRFRQSPSLFSSWGGTAPSALRFPVRPVTTIGSRARNGEFTMGNLLHYALVFLVVALIAAAVGFGGVAGFAMEAARLLFWVFIILFVISLIAGLVRRA